MCKTQISKKLISFLMSIVMILTSIPLLGVAGFLTEIKAYAATGSGQTSISNGGNYGLNWAYIYGVGWSKIPTYNRALAGGKAYDSSDTTNMLKKYLVSGRGGSQKDPSPSDIPVYRLSRSNGYTNPDSSLISVNAIKIEDWKTLQTNAKADNIILSNKQAQMINAVMYFGLKQFKNDSCAEQLEFLATQSLIWEISEGKRIGWGNETAYVSTGSYDSGNKNYASTSNSKNRSDAITKAYSGDKKSRYYWHDYYYTQYYNKFKNNGSYYTDYYQKILTACSAYKTDLTFTSSNSVSGTKKWSTTKSSASTGEASWNGSAYTFTMTLPSGTVGTGIGQYDIKNMTLPSGVTASASGNKITFTIKNIKNATYGITWYQTVPTGFNSAYYYKTKSSYGDGIRGYVNCGNISKTNIYFNLKTVAYTVTYKCAYADCGYSSQTISTETVAKNGKPKNVPAQHTHTQQTFKGWYKGSSIVGKNGTANEIKALKIIANTTFNAKYEGWHSVTYICGYCGEEIKSETKTQGSNVSTPSSTACKNHMQEHQEEGIRVESTNIWYTNKNLTTKANISCGSNVAVTNKDQTFYLGYQKLATVNFVCAFEEITDEDDNGNPIYTYCDNKNIASYKDKIVGTNVSVPNAHIAGGNINHYTRGYEFAYWAIKNDNGQFEKANDIKGNNVKVIKDITYYAVYNKVGDPCDVTIKYININELEYGYNGNLDAVTPLKTISAAAVLNKTNLVTGDVLDLSSESYFTDIYTTTNENGDTLDFTYTGNYLIANSEADLSSIDISDLSVDETKDFSCNNEFVVDEDKTVYVFYDTEVAGVVNVYVFSSRPDIADGGLFAHPTNDVKDALTIDYSYNTLEKHDENGIANESIEKTGSYQASNTVQSLGDNLPNGYPYLNEETNQALYTKYVKLSFSPDPEELNAMDGLIPYTFSVSDENSAFDYVPGTVVGNYIGKGCETNVFFLAEIEMPKLSFKVVDSNGKPLENVDLNVCSNDMVLNDVATAVITNQNNSAIHGFLDIFGKDYKFNEITIDDVFKKNTNGDDNATILSTQLTTDKNGCTPSIGMNYLKCYPKFASGVYETFALQSLFYLEDSNNVCKSILGAGFDIDVYCSNLTEDKYELNQIYKNYDYYPYINPVSNEKEADISDRAVPITLYDNIGWSNQYDSDSSLKKLISLGNIQIVIKLKKPNPVTVNICSPEHFEEMPYFETSVSSGVFNTGNAVFKFENSPQIKENYYEDTPLYKNGYYNSSTNIDYLSLNKEKYLYYNTFDVQPLKIGQTILTTTSLKLPETIENKYYLSTEQVVFNYNPSEKQVINIILTEKPSDEKKLHVIVDVVDNTGLNLSNNELSNTLKIPNISVYNSQNKVNPTYDNYNGDEEFNYIQGYTVSKNDNITRHYYSYSANQEYGLYFDDVIRYNLQSYSPQNKELISGEGFAKQYLEGCNVDMYSLGFVTKESKLFGSNKTKDSNYLSTSEFLSKVNNLTDNDKADSAINYNQSFDGEVNIISSVVPNGTPVYLNVLNNCYQISSDTMQPKLKNPSLNKPVENTLSTALYVRIELKPVKYELNVDVADKTKVELIKEAYKSENTETKDKLYGEAYVKNAEVEIYGENGALIEKGITNSDEKYNSIHTKVAPGNYTLILKTAPKGYNYTNKNKYQITVHKNGIITKDDFTEQDNYPYAATTFLVESKNVDENENIEINFVTPANTKGYTYGTDVVSTFMVTNKSADFSYADKTIDGTSKPKVVDPLKTAFTATVNYTVNGKTNTYELFKQTDKQLVLPAKENEESTDRTNLLYYRWYVPTEDEIKEKIIEDNSDINKDEIILGNINCKGTVISSYDPSVRAINSDTVKLITQDDSTVKSDGYNLDGGKSFIYKEPSANKDYFNVATWEEWICIDGEFSKVTNKATLGYSSNLLFPDGNNPTNGVKNQSWTTRSGYALNTNVIATATVESTIPSIINGSCTPAQTGEIYYPEYNYNRTDKQFEPLVLNKTTNTFEFKSMTNAGTTGNKHMTPVWFPNGNYITQTIVSDMWTPVGKLNYLGKSNAVQIEGSLFDDYNTNEKTR